MAVPGTFEEFQRRWEEFCAGLTHEEIVDTLGLVPYAVSEDSLSFAMPLADRLRQAGGMFSATALFGAADITGTWNRPISAVGSDAVKPMIKAPNCDACTATKAAGSLLPTNSSRHISRVPS